MDYTQLDYQLRIAVERNRKSYNKRWGYDKDEAKFNNNIPAKFVFSDSPEGDLFWRVVTYCEDMTHLQIMPEYQKWRKNKSKELFNKITFLLSMLLYAWLLYIFYLYLAPTQEIRNLLLFR